MKCLNCEKDFEINENRKQDRRRKFCNSSCANSYNNKNIRYKKTELNINDSKFCKKCGIEKSINEFYKRKESVDGYRNECKKCLNGIIVNSTNVKENKKKYYQNNSEKVKERAKSYRIKNTEAIREKKSLYQTSNKSKRNEYLRERYNNDVLYRISVNVRSTILKAFKRNGFSKKSKSADILGCSFIELKLHIESQFKIGMTWDNHGEWHIDHKIPLSWAKNEDEMKELCNYKNLQPLWSFENLSKKNYYSN